MADPAKLLDRDAPGYEEDFCLWAEAQAALLRDGHFNALDIEKLAEEIEGMARREKRGIRSDLVVVLKHLLKYKYQPEKRSGSWNASIIEHRRRLEEDLEESPSLRRHLLDRYRHCYDSARRQAAEETGLPLSCFPENPDFDLGAALDTAFWPESAALDLEAE